MLKNKLKLFFLAIFYIIAGQFLGLVLQTQVARIINTVHEGSTTFLPGWVTIFYLVVWFFIGPLIAVFGLDLIFKKFSLPVKIILGTILGIIISLRLIL